MIYGKKNEKSVTIDSHHNRSEKEWLDGGKIIFKELKQLPTFTFNNINTQEKLVHEQKKNLSNFQLSPLIMPNKYLKRKNAQYVKNITSKNGFFFNSSLFMYTSIFCVYSIQDNANLNEKSLLLDCPLQICFGKN